MVVIIFLTINGHNNFLLRWCTITYYFMSQQHEHKLITNYVVVKFGKLLETWRHERKAIFIKIWLQAKLKAELFGVNHLNEGRHRHLLDDALQLPIVIYLLSAVRGKRNFF